METTDPKFYILQQYAPNNIGANEDGCVNIYYAEIEGKDKIWIGYPEKATRFTSIGEAMKVSARLSSEVKNVYFKAIPIYNEEVLDRKKQSVNKN